jgi:hypothetical protein
MVTSDAAAILRIAPDSGDCIVVPDRGQSPAEALRDLPPELVFVAGRLKLASEAMARRIAPSLLEGFQPIEVEGRGRFLIDCDIPPHTSDTRLAGRRVA